MHQTGSPRKAVSATSPFAFAALVVANVALAFGPLFVRLADVGPVAAGFWRIALAAPILVAMAFASGWRPAGVAKGVWIAIALGGLCFAADLASWHIGILKTSLANATLFGNSATLFFPVYGFLIARAWPSRMQGFALLLALVGAALLDGPVVPDRARASRGRLALPARGHPLHLLFRRDGEGARHDGADPRIGGVDLGERAAAAAVRAVPARTGDAAATGLR